MVDQTARTTNAGKPDEMMSLGQTEVEGGEGTFVLTIEAKKNIDLMCQEGTPRIEDRQYGGGNQSGYRSYSMASSRMQSIVITKDNFRDMPVISKCLPDVKTVSSEPSQILSEAKMHVLGYHLPGTSRLSKW